MTKIGSTLIAALLLATQAFASITVKSYSDREEIGKDDAVTITVSVSSTESADISEPRLPQLDGFQLQDSSQSTSVSSHLMQTPSGMEFQSVRRHDFNYVFTPTKMGKLSIPSFEVTVNGKVMVTQPFTVTVSNNPTQGMNVQDEPQDEVDQLFQQLLQRRGVNPQPQYRAAPKNPNESFFIQLEVDKTEAYEGEQVTANWYILAQGNILSLDRAKFPDLKGFWKEPVEEIPTLNFTQEVINGRPYRKALLASYALFPIKSGVAVIDEYKVKASIQIPSGPYGSFGFGPAYTFTRSSDRVKVNVKPLPVDGKPGNFSGAVGSFDVRSRVEGSKFPVNQPFSVKIRFEGEGNAKMIELPSLDWPASLEVYDTKTESQFLKNGQSYKEFEVLLIPRASGIVQIPSMSFSMFDPKRNQYVQKGTEPITVEITGSAAAAAVQTPSSPISSGQTAAVTSSEQTFQPAIRVQWASAGFLDSDHKNILWILVYALIALVLAVKAKKDLFTFEESQKLIQLLQVKLKSSRKKMKAQDYRGVATEIINCFYLVLGKIANSSSQDLESLMRQTPPSVLSKFEKDIRQTFEIFQIIGFAPDTVAEGLRSKENMERSIDKASDLLTSIAKMGDEE